MSGADTTRGITFQTVVALAEAIAMVTDPAAVLLRVEGREDIVDYEVIGAAGKRLRVRQAKTKAEPYTWSAAGLLPVLRAWAALPDVAEAEFEFVTDGQLGTTGVQLCEVIQAAKAGADEAEIAVKASGIGRTGDTLPPADLLRRVTITTRAGSLNQILESLEYRVLVLMQRARPVTIEDAIAVVDGLFRHLFVIGSEQQPSRREVGRDEVLARLGLSEEDLARGEEWGDAVASAYAAAVLSDPVRDDIITLEVLPAASLPRVLRLSGTVHDQDVQQAEPLTALLAGAPSLLIGATGEGKSTSLQSLERQAAGRGDIPVLLPAGGHQPGDLPHRVRARVEALLGKPLTAGAVDALLSDPRLVLLLDGVSETDGHAREALRADLAWLTAHKPPRFVLTGRDLAVVRATLPDQAADAGAFRLIGLNHASRRAIARTRCPARASDGMVLDIERRLGRAVDNPMLFAMALAVAAESGAIRDRPHVYEQFLRGLTARARMHDPEFDLLVLGGAYAEFVKTGQRATDRYTLMDLLSASLQRALQLPAWRGTHSSAAEILARAQTIGLIFRPDPDMGLAPVHDSFADYLAAVAVIRGASDRPAQLTSAHDEQILFFAEMAGLDALLARQLAAQDPLLACRAAALPAAEADAGPDEVAALLLLLRGDKDLPLLNAGGLRLVRHPQATMLVLGGNGNAIADLDQYQELARYHPSITLPARSGSLRVAIHGWASAVGHAASPHKPLFTPQPGNNPDVAVKLLAAHADETEHAVQTLVGAVLPASAADRVQQTLGLRALTAVVDDPEPGPFGEPVIPVHYRHGLGPTLVVRRGDPRVDPASLTATTQADQLLRRHPSQEAADLIMQTLIALTHETWPVP